MSPQELLDSLPPHLQAYLPYCWEAWARPEQLAPPGDWNIWQFLAGRGCGKSHAGAQWIRAMAMANPGSHAALVAPTAADARDIMVKAILSVSPPGEVHDEPSKRLLRWGNGSIATTYSAEEPRRLRGPNHTHGWADELCAWQYITETWDMLALTLRIGERPRLVVTTTPRPLELLTGDGKDGRRLGLLNRDDVVTTRGTTYDNRANLSPAFLQQMKDRYEGTRLGDQELMGLVVAEDSGALFKRDDIDARRVSVVPPDVEIGRVVIAVDPATTSGEDADETGIIVVGRGSDGRGYVLADYSGRYSPEQWAKKVSWAYETHTASRVIGEKNQGGDMVERNLRVENPRISYRGVHVRHGKFLRAEPVSALYEKRLICHVGSLDKLEYQMYRFMPEGILDGNDDRVDALAHALTELMLGAHIELGDAPVLSGTRRMDDVSPDEDEDEDEDNARWLQR